MKRFLAVSAAVLLLVSGAYAGSNAFLGVVPERIDEEVAEDLGYKGKGVYIPSVVDDSAADKAGIEDDDVIVELDGDKIVGPGHLRDILSLHAPGDKVKVKVWRDGKTHTMTAELGEHEGVADKMKKIVTKIRICDEPKAWLGVKVQSLTEQLGDYFGSDEGVLVSEVVDDSPAKKAGLEAGDVITGVDDKEVEEPRDLPKAISDKEPGTKVSLALVRDGKTLTKEVELAEPPEGCRKKHRMRVWHSGGDEDCMMIKKGLFGLEGLEGLEALKHLEGLEALKDIEIDIEVHEDMEDLREELEELREELEELKKNLKESK